MKQCPTFSAKIFVGLREGYHGRVHDIREVKRTALKYCRAVGLCVTVTKTTFVYGGGAESGMEPGAIVGLINYPRFPKEAFEIRELALVLARRLKHNCGQNRVSVMFPDETVMLEG